MSTPRLCFPASITYLILHLGNIQEILDFVNMYSLFKNRSASCICGNYLSLLTTGYMLFPVIYDTRWWKHAVTAFFLTY